MKKKHLLIHLEYPKSEDTKLTISIIALFNTEVFLFCKLGCTKLNLGRGGWRDYKSWVFSFFDRKKDKVWLNRRRKGFC